MHTAVAIPTTDINNTTDQRIVAVTQSVSNGWNEKYD